MRNSRPTLRSITNSLSPAILTIALAAVLPISAAAADPATGSATDQMRASATLTQIRDVALASDWAYQRLTVLTDQIGPRLSGSPGAAAAVTYVAEALKKLGMQVTLQPVSGGVPGPAR